MDTPQRHRTIEDNNTSAIPARSRAASAHLERGAALLAAGDEALERALGRDSRQFLSQVRQEGGQ